MGADGMQAEAGQQQGPGRVRRWAASAAPFLVGMGLGIPLAWGLVRSGGDVGALLGLDGPLPREVLLVWLPVVVFLVLLVHEVGHVLGGRMAGFRFLFLVVGPLELRRDGGVPHGGVPHGGVLRGGVPPGRARGAGLRVRLNRHVGLAGGVAGCVPGDDTRLRARMALFTAGGPLASLVLAVLALLSRRLWGGVPGALLGLTGLFSAAVFVLTVLPLRGSGFASDGARLGMLARGGAEAERWCGLAALSAASMGGVRPRDWMAALLSRATALQDGSPDDVSATLLAYARAVDAGELDVAETHLQRALELRGRLAAAFQPGVALEGAFFAAYYRGDAVGARRWLELGRGGFVEPHVRQRSEAAVLLVEGRAAEALFRARQGLTQLPRSWDAGGALLERDRLEALQRQAEAVLRDAPGTRDAAHV